IFGVIAFLSVMMQTEANARDKGQSEGRNQALNQGPAEAQNQGLSAAQPPAEKIVVYGELTHLSDSSLDFSYEPYKLLQKQQVKQVAVDKDGNFFFTMEADAPIRGFFMFGKIPVTYTFSFPLADGRDSTADFSTFDPRLVFLYLEPG